MASLSVEGPRRVALYARVSTDEQAERGTIRTQTDFLRRFADLYSWVISGEYTDDGISGTIPLADRPGGRRMLDDARAGLFVEVVVYKLDRLGRSTLSLLRSHDDLEKVKVTIRSATEPFDTSTSFGKFMFQFLASLAELERGTITERMTGGRDRVAKEGKWTGGPVPFGYEVDATGCLALSERMIIGRTEAAIAREVIERVANGSSCVAEAGRLNALGVPAFKRWSSGKELTATVSAGLWMPDRVNYMVRNPAYAGTHTLKSKNGPVARPVPALVDRVTWDRAQAQIVKNRILATRNHRRFYLLSGLVKCACGRGYCGCGGGRKGGGSAIGWYRCLSQTGSGRHYEQCGGKGVHAKVLESIVWADCRQWARDPGAALADAQAQLRARLDKAPALEEERRGLQRALAAKEVERGRVMTLFRRGKATLEETEQQLDSIQREASDLQSQSEGLRAQQELSEAFESHFFEAAAMLSRVHERIGEIEAGLESTDPDTLMAAQRDQRAVIESLVASITIRTEGERYHNKATAEITYRFGPPSAVDTDKGYPTLDNRTISLERATVLA